MAAPTSRLAQFVKWMGPALPSLLGTIVMLVLGYWVKDSVDIALKRQQMQLSFAKEMQAQLDTMSKPESDISTAERAAVLLSTFGEPAITPLLNEMRYGGNRSIAAEAGLRALALTDADGLCRVLPNVLTSRSQQFGWETHLRVIRLLGAANCVNTKPVLVAYQRSIRDAREGKSKEYFELIADSPKDDQLNQVSGALERTIKIL